MSSEMKSKPRILGIICNWCCYGGADLAGVSRFQYPPYIRLMRVMCSGRVDMTHVFKAFSRGADGVFIGGCHLNDCHYITNGNFDAFNMVQLSKKILEHIGVNPNRLRIEWVSAGEGIRFANIMSEFGAQVQELGPLGQSEGLDKNLLKDKLAEITRLIPYIKVQNKKKLSVRFDETQEYQEMFSREEIDQLLNNVISYYIDPTKCQACMTCAGRCPQEAIISAKNQIHVIDQEKCIKCGACFAACPPRFGAIAEIYGEPVPPPLPEAERTVVRKSKAN